jgi:MFS family permease
MFYTLRFLLGFAEAGFFPGIIYYLAVWYPEQRRGRIYALFMTGIAIAGVIGSPLSGWILQSSAGYYGLAGWQWLFLIEALPSIIIGLVLFVYLDDNITAARWLTPREKQLLLANLQPKIKPQTITKFTLRQIFFNPQVWQLSLIYFCFSIGLYGVSFWLPSLIKGAGVNNELQIGLLTAIPYGCAIIAMLLVGRSSDLRHERRWHLAIPALIGGLSLYASTSFTNNLVFSMILLSIATAAILSIIPLFWSLPTTTFSGMMVASAIAWINSVGNLAGFVSPYLVGYLKDSTGSMHSGLNFVCWALTIGAWLVLWFKPRRNY